MRQNGFIVTRHLVQLHSEVVAQKQNNANLTVTNSWCTRFMKRCGLTTSQKPSWLQASTAISPRSYKPPPPLVTSPHTYKPPGYMPLWLQAPIVVRPPGYKPP